LNQKAKELILVELEIIDCEECGGSGFGSQGTGYDSVCDNCGGQGRHPK
jgi:DnaJ-class molecular chaperone